MTSLFIRPERRMRGESFRSYHGEQTRMAKFKATFATEDGTDLTADNQRIGQNPKYALIEPGYHVATVTKIADDNWRGTYRTRDESKTELKNPNAPDGKWDYAKVKATFEIHNEQGTLITKQLTVGIVDTKTGQLIRPEGGNKDVIWGGDFGALFFFSAIGLIEKTGDNEHQLRDVDTSVIAGRVLTIRTSIVGYQKEGKKNYDAAKLTELLIVQNDNQPYTFDQIPDLVAAYNVANNLTGDAVLRVRNEISGYFPLSAQAIADGDFFVDEETKAVYINEAAWDIERELNESAAGGSEPADW